MTDHPVPASAVELTEEELVERGQRMYALDQQIRGGLRKGREGLWEAAKAIYDFDAQNGWSARGLDYESVSHYCADPEIGISRSTYHRLKRVYEQTVVLRKVDFDRVKQIDYSKVDLVLDKVRNGKKKIDDALDDAEALGQRDLRDEYWGPRPEDTESAIDGTASDEETDLVGLDDEPVYEGSVEEDEFDAVAENAPAAPETETDPQSIYGEVLFSQVREALGACRQGLDSPSDLLRRVALEKAVKALEAVLDVS
jgi:hypothetical protein